jgi:hypothetical protein
MRSVCFTLVQAVWCGSSKVDALLTSLALALPVLLGGLWLNVLIPGATTARTALVWGHGALIGLILIPQVMYTLDSLGMGLSFQLPATIAGLLILVALVVSLATRDRRRGAPSEIQAAYRMPPAQRVLYLGLLLLIVIRIVTIGLEVFWRPLFPWDATMHWATKARVWFEHGTMVPFVDNGTWLKTFGEGVYTDRHPDYPATIPLLQVWMNLATDRWDESLMNLPWLVCLMAMGAAFYGQLRVAGVRPALSITFTYFLLSMPLVNTHAALAGYADLFLGATYCAALMALHNWVSGRQGWQILLMVLFTLACMRLKTEGYLWSLTLVAGLVVALASRHAFIRLAVLALVGLVVLAVFRQFAPDSLHPFLQQFTPFSMKGLLGIIKSVFLHANWHLFTYLLPVIAVLSLLLSMSVVKTYRGIATALIISVGAFLFLFLFTVFWMGAANFTGVGRLSLQLVPGLMFLCALLSNEILTRGSVRAAPGKGTDKLTHPNW